MNRRENIKKRFSEESGAVAIVEAAIVFPVMFFVLFFIIFLGNIYYQQARVDEIVARYAINGANRITNPIQRQLNQSGSIVTDPEEVKVQPYRYLFHSMRDIEEDIRDEIYNEITSNGFTFLNGNRPEITRGQIKAKYNNYILYGNFVVEASYQIRFPIRFIMSDDIILFKSSACAQAAVNDVPEFVRNVDLTIDLIEGTEFGKMIESAFDKIKEFIGNFS